MNKTLRRMALLFAAAVMVMMMAVPAFADTITATVHFKTFNTNNVTIYDKWQQPHYTVAKDVSQEVTFNTTGFDSIIPGATESNHQYMHTPTVMDAIYTAYMIKNGGTSGWANYWDTSSDPKGTYLYTAFNNTQVTTELSDGHWAGYTWLLYMNTTSLDSTWNSSSRSGMLPYYGSNVVLQNGDDIYVRYLGASQDY